MTTSAIEPSALSGRCPQAILGHQIAVLQRVQYQLQRAYGLAFGYAICLGQVHRIATGGTLLPPAPEQETLALLQVLGGEEVRAVLEKIGEAFAERTSLEDVVQALCAAYSTGVLASKQRRRSP